MVGDLSFTSRFDWEPPTGGVILIGTIAPPEILRGVKVLIVDDNRTNRRILEGMLKRWDMKSTSVPSGEEALVQLSAAWELRSLLG